MDKSGLSFSRSILKSTDLFLSAGSLSEDEIDLLIEEEQIAFATQKMEEVNK